MSHTISKYILHTIIFLLLSYFAYYDLTTKKSMWEDIMAKTLVQATFFKKKINKRKLIILSLKSFNIMIFKL